MDAHPIPQNVTSFQFRLIGDMTLKQFVYLASGVGIAYLLFVFAAARFPLLAWPLIVISSLFGIAFAFLPIASRPLDYWLGAFLKAIYSPTKRAWRKDGKTYLENPLFRSRLVMFNSSLQPTPTIFTPALPTQPAPLIPQMPQPQQVVTPATPSPQLTPTPSSSDLPTKDELQKTVDLAKQAQSLQAQIIQTERALDQMRAQASGPQPPPADYSEQVNKIMVDLQKLVGQASEIKKQLESITHPQPSPLPTPLRQKVKILIPPKAKQTQLALTTFPNVINGIIKDSKDNYLEAAVTVIYDREGLPVRALKTNKLGQFSGSTPLPNGVYTLELEKEGYTFDVLQIELTGEVLPPLIITAKG